MAGLWEDWNAKESDDSLQSTAIITTAANDFMNQLHHRMPIVLQQDAADRWLAGDDGVLAEASPAFRAWPVDRRVNNARNEGAELFKPVGEALAG